MRKVSLIIIMLLVVSFGYADDNGIWHRAQDVRGGIFGENEQDVTSGYSFINPVTFNEAITSTGVATMNGATTINGVATMGVTTINGVATINNNLIVNGRIGIGKSNPLVALDIAGTIRAEQICDEAGGNCKDISTGWVTSPWTISGNNIYRNVGNVGIGTTTPTSQLQVAGTISADHICIGGTCKSGWPIVETGSEDIPSGYEETYWNFGEDSYGSWIQRSPYLHWTTPTSTDTCNGVTNSMYICAPSETRSCRDWGTYPYSYECGGRNMETCYGTGYQYRLVECQAAKVLLQNEANENTYTGTATITGRDYSGSSEKCSVQFTSPQCSFSKTSPSMGEWDDAKCEAWLEKGILVDGFCANPKNIISVNWALSGSTGPVNIKYIS